VAAEWGLLIKSQETVRSRSVSLNDLRIDYGAVAPYLPQDDQIMPPDLARVVEAWLTLPPAIRAGILALVQASSPATLHCERGRPTTGAIRASDTPPRSGRLK
jgi:hypothetical protein